MKYLGIDFGEKNVGIATAIDSKIAFPKAVFNNDNKLLEKIELIVDNEKIDEIVIGESRDYSGKPNQIMAKIEKFTEILEEKLKLPVRFEQEFLTSKEAERLQGKNDQLDASAAAIILQSYLDRNQGLL